MSFPKKSSVSSSPCALSLVVPCYNEETTLANCIKRVLALQSESLNLEIIIVDDCSQDRSLSVALELENSWAGFTSLGERGKRAEVVAEEAARECVDFLGTGAVIDEHLADQLVPLMALARGRSSFATSRITPHLLTNVWVVEQFLPVKFWISGDEGEPGEVSVYGVGRGQSED